MSIELIEQLRRLAEVFGGKCAEDCTEAADRIEELEKERDQLREQVKMLSAWIKQQGEITDTCTFNLLREVCENCACHRNKALAATPNEALQAFAEKVREQCVMECEKIIGGKVKNEQWWYGFRAGVSQSISVINKLKELPK